MNFDGIIFDLDGTLWDSTDSICIAWNEILKSAGLSRQSITKEELGDCMGLPMYEIAAKLFPKEPKDVQVKIMDEMCAYENEYLAEHGGRLYDNLENVLKELSKNYKLFIVSNCQEGYIEAFLSAHKLDKYFTDTECWGRTRLSKGESNKILINRNKLKAPVYVGDTAGDAQSAIDAGIPFIYASYGFGNVTSYYNKLDNFNDLLKIF